MIRTRDPYFIDEHVATPERRALEAEAFCTLGSDCLCIEVCSRPNQNCPHNRRRVHGPRSEVCHPAIA